MIEGRTTFVNTLCGKKVLQHKDSDDPANAHIEEGVKIKPVNVGKFDSIASSRASGMLTQGRVGRGGNSHIIDHRRHPWLR